MVETTSSWGPSLFIVPSLPFAGRFRPAGCSMNANKSARRNRRSRRRPMRRQGNKPSFVHRRSDASLTFRKSAASPMSSNSIVSVDPPPSPLTQWSLCLRAGSLTCCTGKSAEAVYRARHPCLHSEDQQGAKPRLSAFSSGQLGECHFQRIPERVPVYLERFEHTHSGEPSRVVRTDRHHRITPSNELVVESLIFCDPLRAPGLSHLPHIAKDAKRLRPCRGSLVQLHLEVLDLGARGFPIL